VGRTQSDLGRLADVPQPVSRVRGAVVDERAHQPDRVEACGAGETAITIVAAAVGNAIFDATGARVREVPFTADRIAAALGAR
jgi:CO/xanthine dehydrogenase Mo-binding subunit